MGNYKELEVWKLSRELVREVYSISSGFPASEQYGLTSQIRRAAVSIACNIAEGSARGGDGDFARFLRISLGSAAEVDTLLILSADLGLLSDEKAAEIQQETKRIGVMLRKLIDAIKT